MKKIPNEIFRYITSIRRVVFYSQQMILYTEEGVYVYIPVCALSNIYSYLNQIDFKDFYPLVNQESDSYQLFRIDDKKEVNILSILLDLYLKSARTISFSYSQVSIIFNRVIENNHRQLQFYYSVQDQIEEMLYPTKPFYNLLLEMNQIYHLLYVGEYFLNEWYQSNPTEYREVLTIRKIDSYNYMGGKIVDFSSSKQDNYIYELANYYQKYYEEDLIINNIEQFFDDFSVTELEKLLFYSLIAYIEEFDWELFVDERNILRYVIKTNSYLSEKYEEYQKGKEEMLKK